MSRGQRKHCPAFQAEVVPEAVKGEETVAQLATRYRSTPARSKLGRKPSPMEPPAYLATVRSRRLGTTPP